MSQSKKSKKGSNDFADLSAIDAARLVVNSALMAQDAGKGVEVIQGAGFIGIMINGIMFNDAGQIVVAPPLDTELKTASGGNNE